MYGGNANFYNLGLLEYPLILEVLTDIAPDGRLDHPVDRRRFRQGARPGRDPESLRLPDRDGPADGERHQAGRHRHRPSPPRRRLPQAGHRLCPGRELSSRRRISPRSSPTAPSARVKYAVERKDPAEDRYLAAIVDAAGAERIVSGIGERPAIVHLTRSGSPASPPARSRIAPHLSTAILAALKAGDVAAAEALRAKFLAFEDQRDANSPIVVLHDGVRLAGIADTGPLQPFLANLDEDGSRAVGAAAQGASATRMRASRGRPAA